MNPQTLCDSICPRASMFQALKQGAFPVLCMAGVWLAADVRAQTTSVTTPPVGYMNMAVPPATAALPVAKTLVSFPLQRPSVDAQPVTSVGMNTITSSAAAWTANAFTAVPYLIMMKSGSSAGRYFLIIANTGTQLTLSTGTSNLTQLVAAGDRYEIFPANTLGTLFGTTSTTVPFLANENYTRADNILLQNGVNFVTYFYDGYTWSQSGGTGDDQQNTVIYPDESVYILRRGTGALSLQSLGAVPTTALQTVVPGKGRYLFANRFPIATTLGGLGLHLLPGWVSNENYTKADQVLFVIDDKNFQVCYFDGANWNAVGGNGDYQNDRIIPAGSGFYVLRYVNSTAADTVLNQSIPYTP